MTPLNPTDRLTVSLEAQQWNQVLALLAEGPYRISAPIIQALHEQLSSPSGAAAKAGADVAPPQPQTNVIPMEAS